MRLILISSFFCAITAGLATPSPIEPPGEIIAFDLSSGYGANGTLPTDSTAPKGEHEVPIPKENGREGSSVTPHPDEATRAHDGAVLDSSSEAANAGSPALCFPGFPPLVAM
ncbi:hypothetical protein DL768_002163 [Monosporascus sp. mg162]|nr:hypothetical protein DL768_002163 [Monosporascus sp. mg162]